MRLVALRFINAILLIWNFPFSLFFSFCIITLPLLWSISMVGRGTYSLNCKSKNYIRKGKHQIMKNKRGNQLLLWSNHQHACNKFYYRIFWRSHTLYSFQSVSTPFCHNTKLLYDSVVPLVVTSSCFTHVDHFSCFPV